MATMFAALRRSSTAAVIRMGCLALSGGMALAAPPAGYRLAWQDDFDGTALDEAKWQYRTDARYWSKQLPANVSVSGGVLNLHLKKETVVSDATTYNYTAGGVISRNLVRYGYYEALMKVPPGRGWHTSFWMMKYNRPATDTVAIELDVLENDSVNLLKYAVNVHRHLPAPHATFGTKTVNTPSLSDSFHLLGCEFTPTTIKYFFDGALVQTVDATLLPHDDMNIWLTSIAASLGGTTSVDDTQLPAVAQYDYVRFYEPFAAPSVSITSPTSSAVTLADASTTLRLEASVSAPSGTPTVAWSLVDGPGSVTFSAPAAALTQVSFSAAGTYTLQCAATNEGGTVSDRVHIGVAAPTHIELRQETGGYQHTATILRSDYPAWNAGSRNQLLVGRNATSPFRSVFSFDLTPLPPGAVIHEAALDLKTVGGSGTVGPLRLRSLSATPIEGTGTADGTAGADLGTGTGATWTTRTGGDQAVDLWSNGGGDFPPDILAETPGFDATLIDQTVTLPATPALTAAVQTAHAAAQPLDLILSAANEATTAAYVRLASDDDSLESNRPALRLSFTGNFAPTVDPGPSPAALTGSPVALGGAVTGSGQWRLLTGPGTASFSDASSATSTVTFDQAGAYLLELTATNPLAETSRTLAVNVVTLDSATLAGWQAQSWPGIDDPLMTGPVADPDHDGHNNLLEWALALTPSHPDTVTSALVVDANSSTFTYTRRKLQAGEAQVRVEWSATLADDWTNAGVQESAPVTLSDTTESVTAVIPSPPGERVFIRIKVLHPAPPP
jgi:beta-glucanase (GH16 family)